MILPNFSHPITPVQSAQIEALTGQSIARMIDAPAQFDEQLPFAPQLASLLAQIDLTPAQWQSLFILRPDVRVQPPFQLIQNIV